DLVRAPGDGSGFNQGGDITEALHHPELGQRLLPFWADLDHTLARAQIVLRKRRVNLPDLGWPAPAHQREVTLIHAIARTVPTQRGMQMAQHAALAGNHQAARGIPVQPVDQFELVRLTGKQLTQRLDHTEIQSAAAVHGQSGRLVHYQQPLALIKDALLQRVEDALPHQHRRIGFRQAYRWDTDQVAGPQAILGLDPPLVDPHLTLAQDAVDQGPGGALEPGQQVVVDTLAGLILADQVGLHG